MPVVLLTNDKAASMTVRADQAQRITEALVSACDIERDKIQVFFPPADEPSIVIHMLESGMEEDAIREEIAGFGFPREVPVTIHSYEPDHTARAGLLRRRPVAK